MNENFKKEFRFHKVGKFNQLVRRNPDAVMRNAWNYAVRHEFSHLPMREILYIYIRVCKTNYYDLTYNYGNSYEYMKYAEGQIKPYVDTVISGLKPAVKNDTYNRMLREIDNEDLPF